MDVESHTFVVDCYGGAGVEVLEGLGFLYRRVFIQLMPVSNAAALVWSEYGSR
jgi:hypothetical protein